MFKKRIKEINLYFKNATGKERQATVDAAIAERKRNAEAARAGRGDRMEQNGDNVESAKENAGIKKGAAKEAASKETVLAEVSRSL